MSKVATNPWVKMRRKAQLEALAVQEGDEITWSGIGGREHRGVVVEVDEEDGTLWAADESGSKALVDIDKVLGKTGHRSPLLAKAFKSKQPKVPQLDAKRAQMSSVNVGDKFLDASDNIYRIARVDNGTLTYEVYSPLQKNWLENSLPVEEFVNEYAPGHHMKQITDAEYDKLFEVLRRGEESEIYDTFRGMYDSKTARQAQMSLQIGDKFEFTDDEGDKVAEIVGQTPDGKFEVQFGYKAGTGNVWTSPVHPLAIERDVESEYWRKVARKKFVTLIDVLSQSVKDKQGQVGYQPESWELGLFNMESGSKITTLDTVTGSREQAIDIGIKKGWDYLIDNYSTLPTDTYVVRIYDATYPTRGTQEVIATFAVEEQGGSNTLKRVMGKINHWASFAKKAQYGPIKHDQPSLPEFMEGAVDIAIKKLRDEGKSPEEIAEQLGIDIERVEKVGKKAQYRMAENLNHWAAFSRAAHRKMQAQVTDSEGTALQVDDRVKDISSGDVGEVWEIDEDTGQVAVRYDYGIVEVNPSSADAGVIKIAKRWNRNAIKAAQKRAQVMGYGEDYGIKAGDKWMTTFEDGTKQIIHVTDVRPVELAGGYKTELWADYEVIDPDTNQVEKTDSAALDIFVDSIQSPYGATWEKIASC